MSYEAEIALQRADDRAWLRDMASHLALCDRPIPSCRMCSDWFDLTPTKGSAT